MKSDIGKLYPRIYRDVLETDMLTEAEDKQFDEWFGHMEQTRRNRFIQTADANGIRDYEAAYGISADPAEDIEFRRMRVWGRMMMQPPFTMRYLRSRLDSMLGEGKYTAWLGEGDDALTLFVEVPVRGDQWQQEVHFFIEQIKPANIVYSYIPELRDGMRISASMGIYTTQWNYRLGGWNLGTGPFGDIQGLEEKNNVDNMTAGFLSGHAEYSADAVKAVLINGSLYIREFVVKRVTGAETEIRYLIPDDAGITEISSIELLGDGDAPLIGVQVAVPCHERMSVKHIISHREGVNDA